MLVGGVDGAEAMEASASGAAAWHLCRGYQRTGRPAARADHGPSWHAVSGRGLCVRSAAAARVPTAAAGGALSLARAAYQPESLREWEGVRKRCGRVTGMPWKPACPNWQGADWRPPFLTTPRSSLPRLGRCVSRCSARGLAASLASYGTRSLPLCCKSSSRSRCAHYFMHRALSHRALTLAIALIFALTLAFDLAPCLASPCAGVGAM